MIVVVFTARCIIMYNRLKVGSDCVENIRYRTVVSAQVQHGSK